MFEMKKLFEEKNIHLAFEIGVILKGIHAVFEIIGGIAFFFLSQDFILQTVYYLTQGELEQDPTDTLSLYLRHSAEHLTGGATYFFAWYLLLHGVIRIFLVFNLLRERLWAFPLSLGIFGTLIFYQVYRFTFTHSLWLLLLTFIDLAVVWLTWKEYQYRKSLQALP